MILRRFMAASYCVSLRIIEMMADTEHLGAIEVRYPDCWRVKSTLSDVGSKGFARE